MRLRKIKNASKVLADNPNFVIQEPESIQRNWHELFANDNPIHLEIGCGKGKFITEMAKQFPKANFIALEKHDSVLIRVLQKLLNEPLDNLRLVHDDAENIANIFTDGEAETLYLNFSDPWPKRRKEKKRLTHPGFLQKYRYILKDNGRIIFKTDDFGFFKYSLMEFNHADGFLIDKLSLDLTASEIFNITTEFEERFTSLGQAIYYLEVVTQRR